MAYIIGIGGVSRSGKSTVAKRLRDKLASMKVFTLDMDNYVLPENDIPKINGHPNWEVPESIDYERILTLLDEKESIYEVIIVEGILAFANMELNKRYDLTVVMEISKATYMERRKQETRWGKDPNWYLEYVWEAHLKYGQYPEADIILSGEIPIDEDDLNPILQKILATPS
ncbi:AAA family ATPase [Ekhidna sp.]|jgi:nicotinamide/nicotinate riboside kinase|uniref:uridine kinase family protein n=1 Tax=Ekhidna sp. TaxID=2608089 RepID=UPI0032F08B00